jgi:hypothetical protein
MLPQQEHKSNCISVKYRAQVCCSKGRNPLANRGAAAATNSGRVIAFERGWLYRLVTHRYSNLHLNA